MIFKNASPVEKIRWLTDFASTGSKQGWPFQVNSMAEASIKETGLQCKLGNLKCALELDRSLSVGAIGVVPCNVCCSEPDFCRDCLCILCGKIINCEYTPYASIRCLARFSESGFCGHASHLMCALECQMAGVVMQLGLDMEYICRRCDQKTDLREHVVHLLDSLRYTNSSTSAERNLGMALQIMQGTQREGAKILESLVKTAIQMMRKGSNIREVFDMLHGAGAEALMENYHGTGEKSNQKGGRGRKAKGNSRVIRMSKNSGNEIQVDGGENQGFLKPLDLDHRARQTETSMTDLIATKEGVYLDPSTSGLLNLVSSAAQQPLEPSTEDMAPVINPENTENVNDVDSQLGVSEFQLVSAGFEKDIKEALDKLEEAQKVEYKVAHDRLIAQKECILKLYQQLEAPNPLSEPPLECTDTSMDQVSQTFHELQKESTNFQSMLGIRNGFGHASKVLLDRFFGESM